MLLTLMIVVSATYVCAGPGRPYQLRLEYLENPIGMDVSRPRFSWALNHTDRAESQSAYQITLFSADIKHKRQQGPMIWNSGRIESNSSTNVEYNGQTLLSASRYFWNVTFWDSKGVESLSSDMAYFHTGLFHQSDWQRWTSTVWLDGEKGNQLRTEVDVASAKVLTAAHVYVMGLGYYHLRINGRKVGDAFLGAFTTFESRLLYDVHDVTDMLTSGRNAIAASLGHGWYAQPSVKVGGRCLLLLLILEYDDSSVMAIGSSKNWKQARGPIILDDIYIGETYDSRLQTIGWDMPNFDDRSWDQAEILSSIPTGQLNASMIPPLLTVQTFVPKAIRQPEPGKFVFDFGQNMAGHCSLHFPNGSVSGSNVTVLHAEMIYENGSIHHLYPNSPELNVYIFDGSKSAIDYEPQFSYYGFRYVQVTGFPGTPTEQSVLAHFTHTDVDQWSNIVFSDDYNVLNKAQNCTRHSSLSNLQSIPTGCTQRERRGWTGDAQLSAEFTIYNFDMAALYTKWMRDMRDTQLYLDITKKSNGAIPDCVPYYNHGGLPGDPAWSIAYPAITYWVHDYYDDERIVFENYEGLKAHLDNTRKLVDNNTGILNFSRYGDWCAAAVPGQVGCNYRSALVSTFYLILNLDIVSMMASTVGQHSDSELYAKEADDRRKAFTLAFFDDSTHMYKDGKLSLQTAQSLALQIGAVSSSNLDGVTESLLQAVHNKKDHLDTGIIGTKYLLPALTHCGNFDLALTIATQPTTPGWGWWVSQQATTLWESWFATEFQPAPNGLQSRNHIMFGSQGPWYYQAIAGINRVPDSRGWKMLEIHPYITNATKINGVAATVGTHRGSIQSSWNRFSTNGISDVDTLIFRHSVRIPVGVAAEVHILTFEYGTQDVTITESGRSVWSNGKFQQGQVGVTGGRAGMGDVVFSVMSGFYQFEVNRI